MNLARLVALLTKRTERTSTARLTRLYTRYERYLSPIALGAGFVWDTLTLTRIDLWLDNLILALYLVLASGSIVLFNLYDAGKVRHRTLATYAPWLPYIIQFAFGGLFSGFVVFYSRSASVVANWPFVIILVLLLVGNEWFRRGYRRLTFQMSMFFVALFSYLIFFLPVILGTFGPKVFVLSGVASLCVILALLLGISRGISYLQHIPPQPWWRRNPFTREGTLIQNPFWHRNLFISIGGIYLTITLLYFTNIIPPIPSALKDIGIFYRVARIDANTYEVDIALPPGYLRYLPHHHAGNVFHRAPAAPVYAFSAVFAPTRLSTTILHQWSHYNEHTRAWETTDQLSFPINGGRDGGYRGYSVKRNIHPGRWRVEVVTNRGQLIGRTTFRVKDVAYPPTLTTEIR